jgi:uncharacterized membrane protein
MDDFARAAFREREARQILRRRAFHVHVAVYAAVNLMLIGVWALVGGGFPWFLFPLMGWGVGVVAHGATAYLLANPSDIVLEREQRRMTQGDPR